MLVRIYVGNKRWMIGVKPWQWEIMNQQKESKMSEPVFQVKGFKGTVVTHGWIRALDA